jgi:predicted enzyme related to lactoylglutathione lyase
MSDGPGIERIGQVAIPVADLERAVAFYSDVLGRRLPDHELWLALCRDSEGNLLALMSEVRP